MALGTINTNQIKDGGIHNVDMAASGTDNPFRSNANEVTSNVTVATSENMGAFGPITVSATITINGVLTIV